MREDSDKDLCKQVDEAMAEVLDQSAPEELFEHIVDCDRCRDARHDAQRALELVASAASDYVHPEDFEDRLLAALDARGGEPAPVAVEPTLVEDDDALPVAGRDGGGSTLAMDDDDAQHALVATAKAAAAAAPRGAEARDAAPISKERGAPPLERAPLVPSTGASAVASLSARLRRPRNTIAVGLVGALAAAAAVSLWFGPTDVETPAALADAPWTGKVVKVTRAAGGEGGLSLCDAAGASCQPAAADAELPAGTVLKTDERTRAFVELGDGTRVALDRSTELALSATANRTAKLHKGGIVAEVAKVEGTTARVELPAGRVDVLGTKFALRTHGDAAAVDVTRGAVLLADATERTVKVRAGEEGRVYPGVAPYVSAATALEKAVSWSEVAEDGEEVAVRGLGELKGKRPGRDEEEAGAVKLTSHKVKVRIVDGFARTEIEETFTNQTDQVLEGIYRFPLPPDAHIERLALDVPGGGFEEGAFVDRDRAAAIWRGAIQNAAPKSKPVLEEIVWVPGPWEDPALLEWQRGGRFELRVFPIPKQASRTIILSYTQVVAPSSGVRRYVYPLAHDPSGALTVDKFDVDVEVRGHDAALGIATQGYALTRGTTGNVDKLTMSATGFVPTGDLVLEYGTPNRDAELSAWAFEPTVATPSTGAVAEKKAKPTQTLDTVPRLAKNDATRADDAALAVVNDDRPYVAIALRPKLPRTAEDAQRAYVMVVDASRSMYGERFQRAAALTARVVGELDRQDRFTVLACDTTCRAMPGGLMEPSAGAASLVAQFLDGISPEGGSDPAAAMQDAGAFSSQAAGRALRVVYVGDGTPTVGPIRPRYLTMAVQDALPSGQASVTAVAIGADADLDALHALARGGGGVVLPYVPGQKVSEAAYAVLGATYGHALREPVVELPEGLVEVAPQVLDTIPAGGERIVVARMTKKAVDGKVVLRGRVGGESYEQTFTLSVAATTDAGNAFVPRLYAAAKIADLEQQGTALARTQAVGLSGAFNVASRYTSLLVLESPAMFKAFGLDNKRRVATWTGEESLRGAASGGDKDLDAPDGKSAERDSGDDADWAKDEFFEREQKSKKGAGEMAAPSAGLGGAQMPSKSSPPSPSPSPSPKPRMSSNDPMLDQAEERSSSPARRRGRGMVPMRKVFDRVATVFPGQLVPLSATAEKIQAAEAELAKDENRREALKSLLSLHMLAGNLDRATELVERWSEKEALDPEALTARADLVARRGQREEAVRLLGSVVDVRPDDVPSQRRLARLHRWAGHEALGCRHNLALAQLREGDAKLLADAVICGRKTGETKLVEAMLAAVDEEVRTRAETLLKSHKDEEGLRGELRLTATWTGGQDLDLALIHPDGHRVSWLGAPTKELITAENVTSTSTEGLALLGSKAGEYAIEIVRSSGEGTATGEVLLHAAGTTRKIPFSLTGERAVVGTLRMGWQARLVPVQGFFGGGSVATRPPPPPPPPIDCGLSPFITNAQGHRVLRPECLR